MPHWNIPYVDLYKVSQEQLIPSIQELLSDSNLAWIKSKSKLSSSLFKTVSLTHGPSSYISLVGSFTISSSGYNWGEQLKQYFQKLYDKTIEDGLIQKKIDPYPMLSSLETHLRLDSEYIYPWIDQFDPYLQRIRRERLYEAEGIRKIWKQFPDFLASLPTTTKKQRDDFQTYALHLVEHHLEYKYWGLYPVTDFLFPETWKMFTQKHHFFAS